MSTTQIILSKRRGRLGISCIDNPDGPGAIVSGLISGSVAYAAGISVGDSILAVNGEDLSGHQQCIAAIDAAPDRIAFVLSRPTRRVLLDKSVGRIGITLATPHAGTGCLVSALEDGSLGFDAGLFVGDTLVAVNGALVWDHREAIDRIDDAERDVELVVVGSTRRVTLRKGGAGSPPIGLTVADRHDGGAGVVVIGLQPGGLALRQMRLGDTILSVNGSLVESHADAIELVDQAPDGACTFVLGPPYADLHAVLNSVAATTTWSEPAFADAPGGCEPVWTRHNQPLHERQHGTNGF